VAAIGGGSTLWGLFFPFLDDPGVRMFGVEAAGRGLDSGEHAASLSRGGPGVLHGNRTYLLQDAHGQIDEAHSISGRPRLPGVGPEHPGCTSWAASSTSPRRTTRRWKPSSFARAWRASSRPWIRRTR
jgi:tryptophan synthase beta chain